MNIFLLFIYYFVTPFSFLLVIDIPTGLLTNQLEKKSDLEKFYASYEYFIDHMEQMTEEQLTQHLERGAKLAKAYRMKGEELLSKQVIEKALIFIDDPKSPYYNHPRFLFLILVDNLVDKHGKHFEMFKASYEYFLQPYNETERIAAQVLAMTFASEGCTDEQNGDYKAAEASYIKALKLIRPGNPDYYNILVGLGINLRKQEKYLEAFQCYNEALNYYKAINDVERQAETYNNISYLYYIKGDVEYSLSYISLALNRLDSVKSPSLKGAIFHSAASSYKQNGDLVKAEHYIREAIQVAENTSNYDPEKKSLYYIFLEELTAHLEKV